MTASPSNSYDPHPILTALRKDTNPMRASELRDLDVMLNTDDEFEAVVAQMVRTHRSKRADYAIDGDRYSNFREAAKAVGITTDTGIEYMIATKQARLKALTTNGRGPENESIRDTLLDRAVYATIAVAFYDENNDDGDD